MNLNASKMLAALLALTLLISGAALAQTGGATLSGVVSGSTGAAIPKASISVKNLSTGQSMQTHSDATGLYAVTNLAPGEYEVSVSAEGFAAKAVTVALVAGGRQTVDVALENPSLSLGDLGFTPTETKGSAAEQARLDRRSHMLKIHQRLGLITIAPLVATLITSGDAGERHSTGSGRGLHAALGGLTAGMYLTTASFAIFAPKVSGTTPRGPIRLHRALAWIHGPGMVLTPVLGAIAYRQLSRGERVHGIAQAHGAVAVATGAAYGLAILSVSIKF